MDGLSFSELIRIAAHQCIYVDSHSQHSFFVIGFHLLFFHSGPDAHIHFVQFVWSYLGVCLVVGSAMLLTACLHNPLATGIAALAVLKSNVDEHLNRFSRNLLGSLGMSSPEMMVAYLDGILAANSWRSLTNN